MPEAFPLSEICNTASWTVRVIYNSLRRCQNGEASCDAEIYHICQTLGGSVEYISRSPVTKKARAMSLVKAGIRNYKELRRLAGCSTRTAYKALHSV